MKQSPFFKLRIVVPVTHGDTVRAALGQIGAGKQGDYDFCSFTYPITGRFRPLAGAHPTIGKVGQLEVVAEEVIETICHENILKEAIAAVKKVHPYEEPAIDILPRFDIE